MMTALTFILYLNASNFDQTEIKTLVFAFLAHGGIEGVIKGIKGEPK